MIRVDFYRKEANDYDLRRFIDVNELNNWLELKKELDEEYYIMHIEFED